MSRPLDVIDGWPAGLETVPAEAVLGRLDGPTLIHLSGAVQPPVFLSVLLHGNETSGWDGLRRLIADTIVRGRPLARSVIVFIGNVRAAAAGVRTLPDQQDYNRIWRGAAGAERDLADAVLTELDDRPLFAAVDLHNNTGQNPHYAVLTRLKPDNYGLAYLFDDQAVYIREPDTVMTRVFDERCPAATLELGPVGDPRCADRAYDFLSRLLALDGLPDADMTRLRIFRTEARVHVPDDVAFSFAGDGLDTPLVLTGGLEAVNFHELAAGIEFAATALPAGRALDVRDTTHAPVTERYFESRGGRLTLREAVIPAMYTVDPAVVRQDCLCYFMTRMGPDSLTG